MSTILIVCLQLPDVSSSLMLWKEDSLTLKGYQTWPTKEKKPPTSQAEFQHRPTLLVIPIMYFIQWYNHNCIHSTVFVKALKNSILLQINCYWWLASTKFVSLPITNCYGMWTRMSLKVVLAECLGSLHWLNGCNLIYMSVVMSLGRVWTALWLVLATCLWHTPPHQCWRLKPVLWPFRDKWVEKVDR